MNKLNLSYFVRGFIPVLSALVLSACAIMPGSGNGGVNRGADVQSFPQQADGKATLDGLRNTVFMGGSAIYNPDEAELNQLTAGMTIPVRLGEVEYVLDPASQQMCYRNVEEKSLYGFLTVQEIDSAHIKIYYRFYQTNGDVLYSASKAIKTNETLDINGDGIADMVYEKMTNTRPGFENAFDLRFISSKDTKKTVMFSMMPEYFASGAYPSGIIGVNNYGKLVVQNTAASTGSPVKGQSRASYQMSGTSRLVLLPEDFVLDQTAGKYGKVTDVSSRQRSVGQAQTLTVDFSTNITIADALPLAHFRISNNNNGMGSQSAQRSFGDAWSDLTTLWNDVSQYHTLDLIDQSPWSYTYQGSDPANKVSLSFSKFKMGIGVLIDGDISWDSFSVDLKGGLYYQIGIGMNGKGSFTYNIYDCNIADICKDILVGPVLITISIPVDIGADLDISAAFQLNYGYEAAGFMGYGVKAGAKIDWDWWDTHIETYANSEVINEHIMRFVGSPEFNGSASIALRPYISSGLQISLWDVFWVAGKLKVFVGPQITASISQNILNVTGQFQAGVDYTGQCGIGMNLLGSYRGWTWNLTALEKTWTIGSSLLIYSAKYWDIEAVNQGTPVPYNNSTTMTYTFSHPGAKKMMLHYDQFLTEDNYDFVYVYDKYGNLVDKSSGSKGGSYSPIVYCDAIIVRVVSDGSVNTVGGKNCQVHVDQILYLC